MNIAELSLKNIEDFGEYTATYFDDRAITNVQQYAHACRFAQVLMDHGISRGDRVVVMMLNSPEVVSAFTAAWKIGAVIIPVTPMWTSREVGYLLNDSGAAVAITSPELAPTVHEAAQGIGTFRELLVIGDSDVPNAANVVEEIESATPYEPVFDADPGDMALLLYTSGTTGDPKGVMLSHENLYSAADMAFQNAQGLENVRSVTSLPMSHIYGVIVMNVGLKLGSCARILRGWDTQAVFEAIEELKVNRLSVVPTMLTYMLNYPDRGKYDTSSLEQVGSGGAPLPEAVRVEFEKEFDCTVKQGYGLSETAAVLTSYHHEEAYRPGSVGRVVPGVEACVMDNDNHQLHAGESGEICARGPHIMRGYLNKDEATKEAIIDGWLHTGDIGHIDEDGYIFITDRKKDIIIKGAENISPKEIEEAIYAHPAVSEAAVFGVPDEKFGENLAAAIVVKHDAKLTEPELLQHLAGYVTKFKIPARVIFLDELPKNPTGKIQKRALRMEHAGLLSGAASKPGT